MKKNGSKTYSTISLYSSFRSVSCKESQKCNKCSCPYWDSWDLKDAMSIIVRGEGLEAQDLMSIVEEFASIHTGYGKATES
jgi:hypothetical protein